MLKMDNIIQLWRVVVPNTKVPITHHENPKQSEAATLLISYRQHFNRLELVIYVRLEFV